MTAEVFTPASLVNQMLDKLPEESWQPTRTFIDPACGNGNMLVEVFIRKILKGISPTQALSTIYGTDIMADNIQECRKRLLHILLQNNQITREDVETVFTNIVCTPLRNYPGGSLDYNFSFKKTKQTKEVNRWYEEIQKDAELFLTSHDDVEIEPEPKNTYDMFSAVLSTKQ